MQFSLAPGGKLTGRIRVPGDKSMSHRSIMLGAIAEGRTSVSGFVEGRTLWRRYRPSERWGSKSVIHNRVD